MQWTWMFTQPPFPPAAERRKAYRQILSSFCSSTGSPASTGSRASTDSRASTAQFGIPWVTDLTKRASSAVRSD
jgi:hypothetical protein